MRNLSAQEQHRLRQKLSRDLGHTVVEALGDPEVSEILINEDGWVRLKGARRVGSERTSTQLGDSQVRAIIHTVAHAEGHVVDEHRCIVEANLPWNGARFTAIVEPVVEAPVVVIRKPSSVVYTLAQYEETGRLTAKGRKALEVAVSMRDNILIVGGTHSGKTTLANAILAHVAEWCPGDRLYVIEDVRELQCSSDDVTRVQTSGSIDRDRLLTVGLRMSPTRVIVGEVRSREALTLLKAWNSGHPGGVCTIHADSAFEGLIKTEQLAAEGTGGWIPRPLVARAVDLVVFMKTVEGLGPCVTEMLWVQGLDSAGEYDCREEAL